jgi:thymidylate synthase (FAD)
MTHTASLVHITPDAENFVAYMARVSNPEAQLGDPSDKLIKYLINHNHWSPFEMVNMCVEINTTRSIAAQILRHRSFSFQEFSQRYSEVQHAPCIPDLRRQDLKNRQNSIDDLPIDLVDDFKFRAGIIANDSFRLYQDMIKAGVAKECARDILPLSTHTRMFMNGTVRSWLHYCDLRTANGTQKEHQIIAAQIQDILYEQLPNLCKAMWDKNSD